jgi:hypothetical protein
LRWPTRCTHSPARTLWPPRVIAKSARDPIPCGTPCRVYMIPLSGMPC